MSDFIADGAQLLGGRVGSGDGEREESMTRQISFEPHAASVLSGRVVIWQTPPHLGSCTLLPTR